MISGFKVLKTGTTICGVMYKDGVVLAADTRATEGPIVADKNCSKLHKISHSIYCAGAGISADLEHTTIWLANNIELHRLNTKKKPKVQMCVSMLIHELYKYQGYKQCAIIIGGYDVTGPHLYSVSPHGSSDSLPFCTMGSGSLNAMSALEEGLYFMIEQGCTLYFIGYRDGMTMQEAVQLAIDAVSAGILNDLGSGSNVDIVVLNKDGSQYQRTVAKVASRTHIPQVRIIPPGTTAVIRQQILNVQEDIVIE